MMLLINKMSDEAGDETQKIENYKKSLADALKPYSIEEFPVCFIDAKDYCEGIDQEDDFLIEISRFQTFIDALNSFVERRGALARFDTPVRIALASVDEAQLIFTRNSDQDSAFLEVLTRFSRIVRTERERLRTKFDSIALEMSSAIEKEGIELAYAVGTTTEDNFKQKISQAELNVQKHCENSTEKLKKLVESAVDDISKEVEKVLQSKLVQALINSLENTQKIFANNVDSEIKIKRSQDQLETLQNIGDLLDIPWSKFTVGRVAVQGNDLLKATNVAGSNLHHVVYGVGKLIGVSFQPWQAVHIAMGISNFALFLGPIFTVVGAGFDVVGMQQEAETQAKMAEARQEITSQFIAIAKNLETQIEQSFREVELQVYGKIEDQISIARHQEENAIAASNTWVKQLIEIRQQFESILGYITNSMKIRE